MTFQNCQDYEQYELVAVIVRPEHFPQSQHILKWKLALESDKNPTEAEEKVESISFLCTKETRRE